MFRLIICFLIFFLQLPAYSQLKIVVSYGNDVYELKNDINITIKHYRKESDIIEMTLDVAIQKYGDSSKFTYHLPRLHEMSFEYLCSNVI